MKRILVVLIALILLLDISTAWVADVTDLTGITGKIGQEDINYGSGQSTDTFDVDTYSGGTQSLTKVPDLRASGYSIIKSKWYVEQSTGDQGSASVEGTLRYILDLVGTTDNVEIELPGNYSYALNTSLTIPSNIRLSIQKGGVITIATGRTLTVNGIIEHAGEIAGLGSFAIGSTGNMRCNGGTISCGGAITINGPFEVGAYQVFTGSGTVVLGSGSVSEVYPEWWGTVSATTINQAAASLTSGGKVTVSPGTYTVASAAITIANSNVTLKLSDKCILNNTTATNYTIKITGSDCAIEGPGKIQVPDSPAIAAPGSTPLRKATIWNTGNRTRIEGVAFTNSISYTIFNEGGDNLQITNNKFYGGYDAYDISDGNNHFAYYQDGGDNTVLTGNYVEYYVMGFGSGAIAEAAGSKIIVTGNIFDHIGQHPVYIANGGDNSVISYNVQKNCGSSFALTGNGIQANFNNIHLDSTLWGAGQSGLSFRNPIGCEAIGNLITGVSSNVILAGENASGGTSIDGLTLSKNQIRMSGGTAYSAIRVGTAGVTTSISNLQIDQNQITGVVAGSSNSTDGMIRVIVTAADGVVSSSIDGNDISLENSAAGIVLFYASGCGIRRNHIGNKTTFGAATIIYGCQIVYCADCDISENVVKTTTSANLTIYDFKEYGTSAQVYNNRYIDNRTITAVTGNKFGSMTLVAGNGSEVQGYRTSEVMDANVGSYFRLRHGDVFFLTASGGVRNFNPAVAEVFPKNFKLDVYNIDGANIITFDSSGLNCAIAAGKHGIFHYSGTAWKGSQID